MAKGDSVCVMFAALPSKTSSARSISAKELDTTIAFDE